MPAYEVIVDPFLLCLPNPCNSHQQLNEFVLAIVGWSGFIDKEDTCVLLSNSARIALFEDDEFPHRHRLTELIRQHDYKTADANTISKVLTSIVERTPTLEEHFGINAILADETVFEITPTVFLDRLKGRCRGAFTDDLLIAGVRDNDYACSGQESCLMVASGRLPETQLPKAITIKADIHEIGTIPERIPQERNLPLALSQGIPVSFCHEELIASLDLWELWNGALNAESVRLCIESAVKNLIASGANASKKCAYSIGGEFINSLHAWDANARRDFAMVTIESCARIVLDIPKNSINEFRVNAKADADQRSRDDGALAFRTHLTKKGVGLRLMFWKHKDGLIEFANIGGKDELEIA